VTVRSGWHYNSPAQSPGQTRQDTRLVPVGTFTPVDAMTSRPGVIPGGTPLLLTGSVMTGSIAVGRAVVQGTSAQGAYPVAVTAAEPITVANGHASLPRIDSVFLVVYDQLYDSSGVTLAAITYVQGTAASSPTAPPAPGTSNSALRLWDILVPAGASAGSPINWATALTDRRTYTGAVGGITPDGATSGAHSGQYRDGGTTTGLERWNGSSWEPRLYLGTAGQVIIGSDTNIKRVSANVLGTDDSFSIGGNLLLSSGRVYRNKVSGTTTVANTTTETALALMTIPASEAQFATYRIKAWGTIANAATTPTHSWKLRLGGVAGTLMADVLFAFGAASSGTRTWSMEADVTLLTTGASGTWHGQLTGVSNMNTNTVINQTGAPVIQNGTASITKDSTVTQDLVITSTWSAAASANTLTCYGYTAERVS